MLERIAATGWHDGALWLPGPPVPHPPDAFTVPDAWPLALLHPVVLAWVVALALQARGPRRAWALAAVALGVRLLVAPWVLMYANGPYLWMVDGTGTAREAFHYGRTWSAVAGLLWYVTGGVPGHVHALNLVVSVLTVPFAHAAVRRATRDDLAADLTALGLALLPLPVLFGRNEAPSALAGLLQAAAVAGALSSRRSGAVLAATSAVLLAELRPDHLPVAALLVGLLALRRRWAAAGLAGAAVLRRAVVIGLELRHVDPTRHELGHEAWRVLDPGFLFGPGGSVAVTDPMLVPLGLLPLVLLAARVAPERRRAVAGLAALFVAGTLPYVSLHLPWDVARFAVPTLTWWVALAACGASALPRGAGAVALAVVAASAVPTAEPEAHRALWTREHAVLRALLPTVPPDATVWFDPARDPNDHFRRWVNLQGHGVWRPWDVGRAAPGDLAWVGRADVVGAPPARPCLEDVDVRPIDGPVWTGEPAPERPVVAGLRRVCAR